MKDFDGDVNARDEANKTPLHHAAIENNYQQATLLLAQGADVSAKDDIGETAIRYAMRHRMYVTLRLLLKRDTDLEDKGKR